MIRYTLALAAILVTVSPVTAHPGHAAAPSPQVNAADASTEEAAVRSVLSNYQSALERLDLRGTEQLFAKDSMIFESGGSEGTYEHYLAHHLTPELGDFKSFKFGDYKVDVRLLGPAAALATETYTYRIETKKGETAERLGVATSVLKKENGRWQIVMSHNSARRPTAK